ncbi:Canalicular multispecific organic anion transporter 1 [Coemansia sp. RSA 1822]|nr:Canalicular multispecific organic anion transporter 1 [Coemansia sp. RSA 638]KAJ2541788.1 Canalicular multispecific organic anion transporter 1 [Coemansia sp. RSA 1853]KAJ2561787.1 Canalicular multispecific organic anion transporter 1 [Coemansia sp. RSA 1822]
MDVSQSLLVISLAQRAAWQAVIYVCSFVSLVYMTGLQQHLLSDTASIVASSPAYFGRADILIGVSVLSIAWPLRAIQLQTKTVRTTISAAAEHARSTWGTLKHQYKGSLGYLWRQILFTQERHLVRTQNERDLTIDDIPELPKSHQLQNICNEFTYDVNERLFLLRAIYRTVWPSLGPLYMAEMLIKGIDMVRILLDGYVMHCLDAPDSHKWYEGYVAALLMLVLKAVQTKTQDINNTTVVGWERVSTALEHEFLRLPLATGGLRRTGGAHASTQHVQTLLNGMQGVHTVLVSTTVVAASAWAISRQVGWLALVPFLVNSASSLMRFACTWMLGSSYDWQDRYSHLYDARIDDISDTIRTVKLFGWERKYLDQHQRPRQFRDDLPWYACFVQALWFAIESIEMIASQISAGIITFAYTRTASSSRQITTAQVFQINDMADNMRYDIESIIPQLRGLHNLVRCYNMIEHFLRGDFVPTLPRSPCEASKPSVTMSECSFTRNRKNPKPVLTDVNFEAVGSELVAVVGKTGAGKSSLLLAICGELEMLHGTGNVCGRVGYLEQTPWIMNDTMRANILFGRDYNAAYMTKVLHACALDDDLAVWPNGDLTVIGDRGINISGGQRARLALARTLYSQADVYLLDDPLSAVDAHVKRHIMEHVILDTGLLGGKLRIVSTHTKQLLPFSNQVVTVEGGTVTIEKQTPQVYQPIERPVDTQADVLPETSSEKDDDEDSDSDDDDGLERWPLRDNLVFMAQLCGVPLIAGVMVAGLSDPLISFVMDGYVLGALHADKESAGTDFTSTLHYLLLNMASSLVERTVSRLRNTLRNSLVDTHFDSRIKRVFVRSVVNAPVSFFDSTTQGHISNAYNTGVDRLSSSVVGLLMHDFGAIVRVALSVYRICHNTPQLLIVAPLAAWLEARRCGVLDRVFESIYEIDREMGVRHQAVSSIMNCSQQMIRMFGVESYFLHHHVIQTDEAQRVRSAQLGVSSLSSTMYDVLNSGNDMLIMWMLLLQFHVGHSKISAGEYLHFSLMANKLVGDIDCLMMFPSKVRMLSDSINVFRRYAGIVPESTESKVPPKVWPTRGEIVFKDFSMQYHEDLPFALRKINLEIRPGEKIGIVGRTGAGKSTLAKSLFRLNDRNTTGSITIDDIDIHTLNVTEQRPRLGIIPQESTLFSGTLRENLDPLRQFTIEDMWAAMIDCNVASIVSTRKDKPANLNTDSDSDDDDDSDDDIDDPGSYRNRKRAWQRAGIFKRIILYMLDEMPAQRSRRVRVHPHNLDRSVRSSTGTLSSGQQQMFSLCRLLMRKRQVIVLDEATAEVDLDTDQDIQRLIREKFSECTILTIAHRLETVMNSDRIVVMHKGEIVEIGPPDELALQNGYFAELVRNNDFGQ